MIPNVSAVMFWSSLKPGMLKNSTAPVTTRRIAESRVTTRRIAESRVTTKRTAESRVTTRRTEESRGCSRRTPPLARLCRAAQQKMCNGINDEEEVLDEKKRFLAEVGAAAMKGKVYSSPIKKK